MPVLWQFVILLAFGIACWGIGNIFSRALLLESSTIPSVGRHGLSFAAGNVIFSYLLTALGFTNLFYKWVLLAILISGIGIAIWQLSVRENDLFGRRSHEDPLPYETNKEIFRENDQDKTFGIWSLIFFAIVAGFLLLTAIIQAAAPPYVRDSLVYHLFCPKEYLKASGLVHLEGNLYSAFPKGHEVLMTLLLAIAGDRAAQGFSLLQHLAMVGGVYSVTRLMARPWTAVLCTFGCATVPPAIYFAGCGYVEPALLMTLTVCLMTLTLLLHSGGENCSEEAVNLKGSAFLGFLAGWMVALKYTGLIYLGLIGFLLLWNQKRASAVKVLNSGAAYSLAAIPGFCWMIWNWDTLGNPVFPMAWSVFGGVDWDETRARAMAIYFDLFGMGKNPLDYLLLPWRLAFSGEFDSVRFDGAMGPFLLVFIIGTVGSTVISVKRQWTKTVPRGMGFAVLFSAAFFVMGTQQARFWMPTQVLACITSAPAIEHLIRLAKKGAAIRLALGTIMVVSLIWNLAFLGKQFFKIAYYKPVLNLEEEKDFLSGKVPGYPAIDFINSHLPERSRTLFVWTGAYGYYLSRPYHSDTFLEDVTLKRFIDSSGNGEELSRRLMEAGFSHLYVQLSLVEKNLEPWQKKIFGDFLTRETKELFRFKDYAVVAVHRD